MLPHQARVVEERSELVERLQRLRTFMLSPAFGAVDPAEQVRLRRQERVMTDFEAILSERIAAFPKD